MRLRINIIGNTRAEYFINGVIVASITTNIPAVPIGAGFSIDKVSGVVSSDLDIDFFSLRTSGR